MLKTIHRQNSRWSNVFFVEDELREAYVMTSLCVEVIDSLLTSSRLSLARHVTIGGAAGAVALGPLGLEST